tara:strand:+ start:2628 stop:5447 length:2820 start_codon:yes stop_codon:yes gene_type:complete
MKKTIVQTHPNMILGEAKSVLVEEGTNRKYTLVKGNKFFIPEGMLVIEGVIGVADVMNENERIYPFKEYKNHIEKMQPAIDRGLYGEMFHPETMEINLERETHRVLEVELLENGDVYGKFLLLDTPHGKICQSRVRSGGQLPVSSRGYGAIDNKNVVTLDYLKTWDVVNEGGFSQALMTTSEVLTESKAKGSKYVTLAFDKTNENKNDIQKETTEFSETNSELLEKLKQLSENFDALKEELETLKGQESKDYSDEIIDLKAELNLSILETNSNSLKNLKMFLKNEYPKFIQESVEKKSESLNESVNENLFGISNTSKDNKRDFVNDTNKMLGEIFGVKSFKFSDFHDAHIGSKKVEKILAIIHKNFDWMSNDFSKFDSLIHILMDLMYVIKTDYKQRAEKLFKSRTHTNKGKRRGKQKELNNSQNATFDSLQHDYDLIRTVEKNIEKLYSKSFGKKGNFAFSPNVYRDIAGLDDRLHKHEHILIALITFLYETESDYLYLSESLNESKDLATIYVNYKGKPYPYYLKRIDATHFAMANSKDGVDIVVPSHIGQHRGEYYFNDVKSWLKGGKDIEGNVYDDVNESLNEAVKRVTEKSFKYDPSIDYLEEYDLLPSEVNEIIDQFDFDGDLYKEAEKTIKKLEKVGWTADYGLDGDIFDLKPIGESKSRKSSKQKRDTITIDGKEYVVKTINRKNKDGINEPYDIYEPVDEYKSETKRRKSRKSLKKSYESYKKKIKETEGEMTLPNPTTSGNVNATQPQDMGSGDAIQSYGDAIASDDKEEKEFEPHFMYKGDEKFWADSYEKHIELASKGFGHDEPKELKEEDVEVQPIKVEFDVKDKVETEEEDEEKEELEEPENQQINDEMDIIDILYDKINDMKVESEFDAFESTELFQNIPSNLKENWNNAPKEVKHLVEKRASILNFNSEKQMYNFWKNQNVIA